MFDKSYCGVYLLRVTSTGHFYIGSAANMPFRRDRHIRELREGRHHNLLLQQLFSKHGETSLEFTVLHTCESRQEAYRLEAQEMEDRATSALLLNIGKHVRGGDNLTRHPNRLDVISRTGQTLKAQIAQLGQAERKSKFGRRGLSNGMWQREHSPVTRQAQSERSQGNRHAAGRVMPLEQRQRLSELAKVRTGAANGFYGRSHSEDTKEKIRQTKLARGCPPPASRKAVSIDGVAYGSIRQAMASLGLSRYIIKQRLADPAFPTYTEIT